MGAETANLFTRIASTCLLRDANASLRTIGSSEPSGADDDRAPSGGMAPLRSENRRRRGYLRLSQGRKQNAEIARVANGLSFGLATRKAAGH